MDRYLTYQDIITQTDAWAESIHVVKKNRAKIEALWNEGFDRILYTGCGSTYYLSLASSVTSQQLIGKGTHAFPASEFILFPNSVLFENIGRTLLIASSRSGRTTETLRAVEAFRRTDLGKVIALTNNPDSPLMSMGDVNLAIPSGQEVAVAQTRSFNSMYIANTAISAIFAERDDLLDSLEGLIPVGKRLIADYELLAREVAEDTTIQQTFFLGSGSLYGLASEATLKLKEISLSTSEAFHYMEFRHGPVSMVDANTLVVGLISDVSRDHEDKVLMEVAELGARTFTLAEARADVVFLSGLPEPIRGVLYLPVLQLMAVYRAVAKDLNPDVLRNLTPVIELALP